METNSSKAFTLMELLIVIAIIGILAVIGLGSYHSSQAKARDTKRKADVSNVSKALTMYYSDHGRFPEANDGEIMGAPWGGEFSSLEGVVYMKKLPSDPVNNVEYVYETDENGSYYRLYTILENSNDMAYEIYQCADGEECNYCIASSNKSCIPVIASGPTGTTSAPTSIPSPISPVLPTPTPVLLSTPTPVLLPTSTPTPTILEANGEACFSGTECDSTFCVDGVCCNTACNTSTCQRCDDYSNAGVGICGYVSSSSEDPDVECGTTNCLTGNCWGSGYACGYYTSGRHNCAICTACNGSGNCANVNECENCYGCTGASHWCYQGSCKSCAWTYVDCYMWPGAYGSSQRCKPSRDSQSGYLDVASGACGWAVSSTANLYDQYSGSGSGDCSVYQCGCQ